MTGRSTLRASSTTGRPTRSRRGPARSSTERFLLQHHEKEAHDAENDAGRVGRGETLAEDQGARGNQNESNGDADGERTDVDVPARAIGEQKPDLDSHGRYRDAESRPVQPGKVRELRRAAGRDGPE